MSKLQYFSRFCTFVHPSSLKYCLFLIRVMVGTAGRTQVQQRTDTVCSLNLPVGAIQISKQHSGVQCCTMVSHGLTTETTDGHLKKAGVINEVHIQNPEFSLHQTNQHSPICIILYLKNSESCTLMIILVLFIMVFMKVYDQFHDG